MRTITALAVLLSFLIGAEATQAHAYLDHANPRVGSSVGAAPAAVSLWFSQNIEPSFSKVEVRDSAGTRVDRGSTRADPRDRSVLRVGVKPLSPGTFKVHWRVLSVDTHTTEGSFSFQVGK